MALWDPTTPNPAASSPGFASGLMGGGFAGLDGDSVSSLLSSLGESLMTSPRGAPLAGFSKALDRQNKETDRRQQQAATMAILVKSGLSPAEARSMSANPGLASLAVQAAQTARTSDADSKAGEIERGGVAGGATPSQATPGPGASNDTPGSNDYVSTVFGVESANDPTAKNPNSTATGLGQFTSGTWAGLMRDRPDLGLTADGRTNPDQSRKATLALAEANADHIGKAGHEPTSQNLYTAHLLGGPGATRFLNGMKQDPDAPAAGYAGADQVAANRPLFYRQDGTPKTAREAYNGFSGKFAGVPSPIGPTQVAGGAPPSAPKFNSPLMASNEEETQAAERATGMTADNPVPPPGPAASVRVAQAGPMTPFSAPSTAAAPAMGRPAQTGQTAQADAPAPGAKPAEYYIPGTTPPAADDPAALFKSPSAARFSYDAATQALNTPNISDNKRRLLEASQKRAYDYLVSSSKISSETSQRKAAAQQYGLDDSSAEGRAFILTGKLPAAETDKITDDLRQRQEAAAKLGLRPNSERYNKYVAGGGYDTANKITPSDRKAISDSEDELPLINGTIDSLKRAKDLNYKTYTGATAKTLGLVGTNTPGMAAFVGIDPAKAANTREMNQIMSLEAIQSMSRTLKGATSEREMANFMEILGDPSTPPPIRERTINRMLDLAQQRQGTMQGRIKELRGLNSDGPAETAAPAAPPAAAPAPAALFSRSALEAEARRRGLAR